MHQIHRNQIVTLVLAVAVFAGAFGLGLAGLMAAGAVLDGDNESAASGISTPSPTSEPETANPTPTYQSSCSMFSSCYNIPPQPTITPRSSTTSAASEPATMSACPRPAGLTAHETC